MYKNKFNIGEHVVIFNSRTGEMEHDSIYGVLFVPTPVEGQQHDESKTIAQQLEDGLLEVSEQYQTLQHQIVPVEALFRDEKECAEYYKELFEGLLK